MTILFGLGLETGVQQVSEMLAHARVADEAVQVVRALFREAIAEA